MVVLAETTKVGITSSLVMTLILVQNKAIRFVHFISLGFKYRLLRMYVNFYNAINPYMLDLNPLFKAYEAGI
jgi:hypothetical protein